MLSDQRDGDNANDGDERQKQRVLDQRYAPIIGNGSQHAFALAATPGGQ
jgi:hypothetical protein